ncbi:hypothetical protein KIPB_000567 [Kipferlia bialata]|uniref:Protein kinase domain-containing protein n=1 Tax=Kipferlia bialata TaxID=797122 RepID=A0A9K3CQR1_9EUKA|nr:hypothetical protein KIPB_000567 [Kipferlia bialata]|eukprot:g567.t1
MSFMGLKDSSPAIDGVQTLQPSSTANARVGHSVSVDGNWMAIGAPYEDGDNGNVYIYFRSFIGASRADDVWTLHTTLSAVVIPCPSCSTDAPPMFGYSLSLSGTWLAVGAPKGNCYNGVDRAHGVLHMYHLIGDQWEYDCLLTEGCPNSNDLRQGHSVSLLADTLLFAGWQNVWTSHYSNGVWGGPSRVIQGGGSDKYRYYCDVSVSDEWAVVACAEYNRVYTFDVTRLEWVVGDTESSIPMRWPSLGGGHYVNVALDRSNGAPHIVVSQSHESPHSVKVLSYEEENWVISQVLDIDNVETVSILEDVIAVGTDQRVTLLTQNDAGEWATDYSVTPELNSSIGGMSLTPDGLYVGSTYLNLDQQAHVGGVQVMPPPNTPALCMRGTGVDVSLSTVGSGLLHASVGEEVSSTVTLLTTSGTPLLTEMSVLAVYEGVKTVCVWGGASTYTCAMTFTDTDTAEYEVLVGCVSNKEISFQTGDVYVVPGAFDAMETQTHYDTSLSGLAQTVPEVVTTDTPVTLKMEIYDIKGNRILTRPDTDSLQFLTAVYSPVSPTIPVWSGTAAWSHPDKAYVVGGGFSPISLRSIGTHSVTFTDAGDATSTVSMVFPVAQGVPSTVTSTITPLSASAGDTVSVTVVAKDRAGIEIGTGVSAKISLSSPDPATPSVPYTDGVGFQTSLSLPTAAGPQTVCVVFAGDGVVGEPVLYMDFYVFAGTPQEVTFDGSLAVRALDSSETLLLSFTLTDVYGNEYYTGTNTYLYVDSEGDASKALCAYADGSYQMSRSLGALSAGSHAVTVGWGETGSVTGTLEVGNPLSASASTLSLRPAAPQVLQQVSALVSLFDIESTVYPTAVSVSVEYETSTASCLYSIGDHAYVCSMTFRDFDSSSYTVRVAPCIGADPLDFLTGSVSMASSGYDAYQTQLYYLQHSLDTVSSPVVAGIPFRILVKVFDEHGRQIESDLGQTTFTASVSSRIATEDAVWSGPVYWSDSDTAYKSALISIHDITTLGSTYDVAFIDSSGTVDSVAMDFSILPGAPFPATSSATNLDGPVGATQTVTVVVRDLQGNEISDVSARMAYGTPDPLSPTASYTSGVGYQQVVTLPTEVGTHTLFVSLSGGYLDTPTAISFESTTTMGPATTMLVSSQFGILGLPSTVYFSLTDSYGNPDTTQHSAFFYLDALGYSSSVECDVTGSGSDMQYCGEVSFGSLEMVGTHPVSAVLDSGALSTGTLTVSQVVSAVESSVQPASLSVVAGERATVNVVVSDPNSAMFHTEVRTTVICEGIESSCAYVTDPNEGAFYSCLLSFADIATTEYQVYVAPLGTTGGGSLLLTSSVSVTPADTSADGTQEMYTSVLGSVILTEPAVPATGQPFVAMLQAFDQFGNRVVTAPADIEVSVSVYLNTGDEHPLTTTHASWDNTTQTFKTDTLVVHSFGQLLCVFTLKHDGDTESSGDVTLGLLVASGAYSSGVTQTYYRQNSIETRPATATTDEPFSLVFKAFNQFGDLIASNPTDMSLVGSVASPTDEHWTGPLTWLETDSVFATGTLSVTDIGSQHTLTVSVTADDGSTVLADLSVLPGVPSVATSSVSLVDGVAGSTQAVTLVARDAAANTLTSVTARIAFDTPDPNAIAASYTAGIGYSTELTLPTVAGTHTLVASLSGGHLSDTTVELEFPVTVSASSPSTLTLLNEFLVDGQDNTVTFTVADAYGNPVTEGFSGVFFLEDAGLDSSEPCTRETGGDGLYVYSAPVSFGTTTLLGVHNVVAILDGGIRCDGQLSVTRLVSSSHSYVEPSTLELTAGAMGGVRVYPMESAGTPYPNQILVTIHIEGNGFGCSYQSDGPESFYSCTMSASDAASTAYEVRVASVTGGDAGLLTYGALDVSMGEIAAQGTQEAYAAVFDTVSTQPETVSEGEDFVAYLKVYDMYGNRALTEPADITVSASVRLEDTPSDVVAYSSATWDSTFQGYVTDAESPLVVKAFGQCKCVFSISSESLVSNDGEVTLSLSVDASEQDEPDALSQLLDLDALYLIGGGLVVSMVVCIACLICCRRGEQTTKTRRLKPLRSPVKGGGDLENQASAPDIGPVGLTNYTPQTPTGTSSFDIGCLVGRTDVIPLVKLQMVHELGQGAYGKVWLVKWRSEKFAVKLFSRSGMSPAHIKGVVAEYEQTKKLYSAFIVDVQCLVMDADNIGFMMRYLSGGTLHDAIHKPGAPMSWDLRSSLAYQIARGCQYLYSGDPPVEHRDLKPANVLLESDGLRCRISDFGQSKVHDTFKTSTLSPAQGTLSYMAPELFNLRFHYSEKTDVWSFGAILWEMISGFLPFQEQSPLRIPSIICSGGGFPFTEGWIPVDAPTVLVSVAQACLSMDPRERPTFNEIVTSLLDIVSNDFDE